jgi:Mg2+ and Co2+ transporter CorA
MDPERPPRDDLDVRLEWSDTGESEMAPLGEPKPRGPATRTDGGARQRTRGARDTPANADPVTSALLSLSSVVDELVEAVAQMQRVVEATATKVDKMQKPARSQGESVEIRDELAELTRQIELLRKRVSLRARNEQLAAETAERIAAAVIDTLAETGSEIGLRPRSRRRDARP